MLFCCCSYGRLSCARCRTDVEPVGGFLVGDVAADEFVFVFVHKSVDQFHQDIHVRRDDR